MGRKFQPEDEHFRFAPFNRNPQPPSVWRRQLPPDRRTNAEVRLYTLAYDGSVTVARIAGEFSIPEERAARILKKHGLVGDPLKAGDLLAPHSRFRLLADDLERAHDSHLGHKPVIRYQSGRIGWL